ncbi:FAD/NAD(P)-binding protein [Roseomonas sp. 18066]|uniref:FAD/NAD(P)-binding protein n=1 Tax=Roseomonas sp. 18066 TaxID=2681412 RepID=UPI00135CBEE2|nr:NAD(P)/FAD-dependent oxidoreductase [Roseomonas sp. 18066]
MSEPRLLEATRQALARLGADPPNWVAPSAADHDVLVVGAGQAGLAIGFALRRAGIARFSLIDAAPSGAEGVWTTCARMHWLRTPKTLPGPELGIPELTFQAWHEARHGAAAYAALDRIPRRDWAAYLAWYRAVLALPVRNDTQATAITPRADGLIAVRLATPGGAREETCRKLVLATGMMGSGGPLVPPGIAAALPPARFSHTEDAIDFGALRGQRVAVLGAASSAFDAAGVALESGAASVDLFCRHADLQRSAPMRTLSYAGAAEHYASLPDADRWRIMRHVRARASGPMPETVRRVTRHANFRLHLGAAPLAVAAVGARVSLRAPRFDGVVDHLILGTGYRVALDLRPELAGIAAAAALWRDRYTPPPAEADAALAGQPYLADDYSFTPRAPGGEAWLGDVHLFGVGGLLSHGKHLGEIASLQHGVPRLVAALGRALFLRDRAAQLARILGAAQPHLAAEDYAASLAGAAA